MLKQVYDMISERRNTIYNDEISSLKEKDIVLYGAGGIGFITSNILKGKGCKICYFIDDNKDKQGTYINGIKVVSLEDIICTAKFTILICIPNPINIYHQLVNLGYKDVRYFPVMMNENDFYNVSLIQKNQSEISKVYGLLADDFSKLVFCNILKHRITIDFSFFSTIVSEKQYFPSDIFSLNDRECFVDGGSYKGETIADFVSATNNKFNYIYGFEPDKQNFHTLFENTLHIGSQRLKLFNAGLYSKTGETGFNSQGNSGSSISEAGNDKIFLVKLDDVVGEYNPTYIKLDIEGAEEEALCGMKNTIMAYHPKLAISIYHKATDLWELPLIIHNFAPSYSIYIRHYTNCLNETICYAI